MKRQLKFRAWDPNEDMMRYEISISYDGVVESSWGKDKYDWIPLQFTGLYDVDGKEIYEGDIIEVYDWGQNAELLVTATVLWDPDDHGWTWGIKGEFYSSTPRFEVDVYDRWRNVKVIGNIYENPELL